MRRPWNAAACWKPSRAVHHKVAPETVSSRLRSGEHTQCPMKDTLQRDHACQRVTWSPPGMGSFFPLGNNAGDTSALQGLELEDEPGPQLRAPCVLRWHMLAPQETPLEFDSPQGWQSPKSEPGQRHRTTTLLSRVI